MIKEGNAWYSCFRYRALYNYVPQNDDEVELKEGDIVYVMEKCDDGWFVGTSQRTGIFGTFPGNHVSKAIFHEKCKSSNTRISRMNASDFIMNNTTGWIIKINSFN